jgi:predicted O-methyltransferase YrrM
MDFPKACTPDVGRLLMLLAAHQPCGRICELGTACGVGAAWLASGMPGSATLVTVEIDSVRADAAASLLAAPNVRS